MQKRWICLIIFWFINFCLGSYYAWGVYINFLIERYVGLNDFFMEPSSLTYIYSTAATVCPITMIFAGYLTDRVGPRVVLFIGGALVALGYFLMGQSTSPETLFGGFGVALAIGCGCGVISTISTAVKLFPDRKGFAGGSVAAFYGVGSICIPLLTGCLGNSLGIVTTLYIYALVCLIVLWGGALLVNLGATSSKKITMVEGDLNWSQMLRTRRFWIMFTAFTAGSISAQLMFSQTVTLAQQQVNLTVSAAVLSISVLGFTNTLARFLAGSLSDKFGRVNTITFALLCSTFGLFLLSLAGSGDQVLFYLGLGFVGFCYGSCVGVFPGFTTEQFGITNASLNYGIMTLAFAAAGVIGPNIVQMTVVDSHFEQAYYAAMFFSVIGLIATYFCRSFEQRK